MRRRAAGAGEDAGPRRHRGETGLDRRTAMVSLAASTALLALLALWLVPWDWLPGGRLVPPRADQVFTSAQLARARGYADYVRPLSYASYAVSLALAALLGLTPLGAWVARRVGGGGRLRWWLQAPLVVLVLLVAGRVVTLPFSLAIRRRNLAEGLTHQPLSAWWADRGLSLLVSWLVTSLLVLVVLGAARRWRRRWFLVAGSLAALLVVVGSFLYPIAVEPLFNSFTPLKDPRLERAVLALADREGVHVDQVLVADALRRTTTLNAYVSGLGDTRRVVLYDTLIDNATPSEVEAVVAHELAHAKHHDVLIGTALGAVAAFAGVCLLALVVDSRRLRRLAGLTTVAEPAAVALLLALLAFGQLLASPAQNTVSRALEARADRTGLHATGEISAFDDLQVRLALRSLADPTPPWLAQLWFGTHPTVLQRLAIAAAVERERR